MLYGAKFPARRDVFARWSIRISIAFILAMVVGSAGSGRLDPRAYGAMGPVAIFLLCLLAAQAAHASSRLAGLLPRDRLTISVEATIRNTNLAILVKASVFPAVAGVADPIGDGMFFVALLYGGVALPVALVPVVIHRRSGGSV
jgi:BASS family bile acid:Na+ symporter